MQFRVRPVFVCIRVSCCGLLSLAAGAFAGPPPSFEVSPTAASQPSPHADADADDVAFWAYPLDYSKSLVIGTQKVGGYSVYDVDGTTLADVKPDGVRYNNVDIIEDFQLGDALIDLVVFSDRISDQLAFYRIQKDAPYLVPVKNLSAGERLFSGANDASAYGLCTWTDDRDGGQYAFVTQNDAANVAQLVLNVEGDGIRPAVVRRFNLAGGSDLDHAEGLVVDAQRRLLHIAQEVVGVYAVDLNAMASLPKEVTLGDDDLWVRESADFLQEDLEGIAIVDTPNAPGWIILSSQGNNTFGVFDRETLEPRARFKVVAGNGFDGSEHCDGVAVFSRFWSPRFPAGVVVVQDGDAAGTGKAAFKWVRLDDILTGMK